MKKYNIDYLKSRDTSPKTMRAEYQKLRRIALKRIQRIEKSKYGPTPLTEKYRYLLDPSTKLTDADLPYALMDVSNYLNAKTSTLTGLKKDLQSKIETFHRHKYNFVNEDNIMEFLEYMDEWRAEANSKLYTSEAAAELFEQAIRLDIDVSLVLKNFDKFRKNKLQLEIYEPKQNEKFINSELFKKIMGIE